MRVIITALANGSSSLGEIYSKHIVLRQAAEESGIVQRVRAKRKESGRLLPLSFWCAEHARQLEGESPFDNLMEVKS
jgi:hypothetical protein